MTDLELADLLATAVFTGQAKGRRTLLGVSTVPAAPQHVVREVCAALVPVFRLIAAQEIQAAAEMGATG